MHSPWYQTTCNSEGSPILHLDNKSQSPLDGTVARHSSNSGVGREPNRIQLWIAHGSVSLYFFYGGLWVVHVPSPVHFILGLLDLGKSLTEWIELLYTGGKLWIGILQKTE